MSKLYSFVFNPFIMLGVAITLISCEGALKGDLSSDVIAKYLPADAMMVMRLDGKRLAEKATHKTTLDQYRNFSKLAQEADLEEISELLGIFQEENGLNLEGAIYTYCKMSRGSYRELEMQVAIAVPLKDSEKLEALLRKLNSNFELKEEYNLKVANTRFTSIGHNDKFFAIVGSQATGKDNMAELKRLLSQPNEKKEASPRLIADSTFKTFIAERHDMATWMSFDPLVREYLNSKEGIKTKGFLALIGPGSTPEDMEGSRIRSSTNFEKGYFSTQTEFLLSDAIRKELGDTWQNSKAFNYGKNIPNEDLLLLISLNLDLNKIDELIQKRNLLPLVSKALMEYELTYNQALKSLGGGLVLGIYMGDNLDFPNVLLGLQLNDNYLLEKMKTFLKASGVDIRDEQTLSYYTPPAFPYSMESEQEPACISTYKDGTLWFGTGSMKSKIAQIANGSVNNPVKVENLNKLESAMMSVYFDGSQIGDEKLMPELPLYTYIEKMVGYMEHEKVDYKAYVKDKSKNSLEVLMKTAME